MKKGLLLIVLLVLILAVYFFTPARQYFSAEGFTQVRAWIEAQGLWAPVIFGLIYIVATILVLPGSVLTLSGGLLFGATWGTLINLLSATLGALCCFIIARYLGRGVAGKMLRGQTKLNELDEKIGHNGFYSVLYLRLIPLFPFNVLNYGLGLTQVSFKDYALATLFGMAPGAFVYTSLGAVGRQVSLSDWHTWTNYQVWGPFLLVILLTLIPKVFRRSSE